MLIIRPQQFDELARAQFESWMMDHLHEFFAGVIAGIPNAEIRDRIRLASKRARTYGFIAPPEICRYIDLTFVLGPAFDQDTDLPWVAEILADRRLTSPEMRMDLLFEAAQDHIDRVKQSSTAEKVQRG